MYTRENPSSEYREMVEMYSTLHEQGAETERTDEKKTAHETFSGKMLMEHAPSIGDLIARTGSHTLLDYGAGKGQAYQRTNIQLETGETAASLQDYWKLDRIQCYDPGHAPFNELPTERFDGAICIDVLEHITAPDLPWVLEELFGYANKFVFATIACYPAKKHLPNGRNAHCTVRSPDWWTGLVHGIAMRHTNVTYRLDLSTKTGRRRKLGGLYGKRTLEHQTVERWG
jgi:hypothetical protein